jgi:hypothetical protein
MKLAEVGLLLVLAGLVAIYFLTKKKKKKAGGRIL